MILINKVYNLLFKSGVSGYRIHRDTNVSQSSIVKYRNKQANVKNMPIYIAEILGHYYDKLHK